MIKIHPSYVQGIQAVGEKEELYEYLQQAIKLEHATIPPYLTAMFSLVPGTNRRIERLIRSVVIEEMLHMTIVSNLLIAIGGSPQINVPGFIPTYPGPLPMGIGGESFVVPIERFSKALVRDVFMAIEEPEDPIPIDPPSAKLEAAALPTFRTIGQFYQAVIDKIEDLGDGIFEPDRAGLQVRMPFPDGDADGLFPITDAAGARAAIEVVVEEGEGTSQSPFDGDELAHYYTFAEIYEGRGIVAKPDGGFGYDGPAIDFDPAGVYPIRPNARLADYPEGSQARRRAERYAVAYSNLLDTLHAAFNGAPERITVAMGLMYDLRVQASALMSTRVPGDPWQTAGPSYEYVYAPSSPVA